MAHIKLTDKTTGIICIILSAMCFTGMNTFVRLSGDLPTFQKVFFRNFVAMFFALFLMLYHHDSFKPVYGCTKYLFLRSFMGIAGMVANFYAIDKLDLSDASMLNKMSPFFALICSAIFLKEKVTPKQAAAIIIAFIGAVFIIKPSFANADFLSSSIGFLGGLGAGAAYTCVRYLGNKGENGRLIVFFFSAFSTAVTAPYFILFYHHMSSVQWLFLVLAGVCAAGGQFSITAAYTHAPSREISVYDYSQVIMSAVVGYFVFGDVPDIFSFIGYFVICAMAIWMFFDNRKQLPPIKKYTNA